MQTDAETRELQAAARALGLELHVLNASRDDEFEAVFTTLLEQGARALVVQSDGLFTSQRDRLVALAARHAVPAIYGRREIAEAGGLMSYANDLAESYHQAGVHCGRILKGEKPADLPVVQPTKFEFVINLARNHDHFCQTQPSTEQQTSAGLRERRSDLSDRRLRWWWSRLQNKYLVSARAGGGTRERR